MQPVIRQTQEQFTCLQRREDREKEITMAVPKLDAPLAEWSSNFQQRGNAQPEAFSLTAQMMAHYTILHNAFISAYNLSKAEGARSRALVQSKADHKAALAAYARELYHMVKASSAVTNENKTLIGVLVREAGGTPTPPPTQAPLVTVISVVGRVVSYKLVDREFPNSRRRPPNAAGAVVMSHVGATPPPIDSPMWKLEGQTGRNTFVVQFAQSVEPGTACWAVARWYSRRGQYSPACEPVQTYLQIGPVRQAA